MDILQNSRLLFIAAATQLFLWYSVTASDYVNGAVRLNISEAYLDVRVDDSLYLKCTGSPPLTWTHEHPLEHDSTDEIEQDITTNSFGNESVNHLTFMSQDSTGRYVCSNNESNSSVYIFVNGEELLINEFHTTLVVGKRNYIPCFPTISNATVTLWKIEGGRKHLIPLRFDPMRGFIVDHVLENMTGDFKCIAEYGDKIQEEMIELRRFGESPSIPEVYIDSTNATYVVVGSSFSLVCIIRTELGVLYKSQWEYPANDSGRATETQEFDSDTHQIEKVVLSITNATESDEGSYWCSAKDHSEKCNFAEVFVTVYEEPPKYNFSFVKKTETIIKHRHENAKLTASYTVFPPVSNIKAVWKKNGKPIEYNFRHSPHYSESEFSLLIPNLSWKDSGLYTVATNISGEIKKKLFILKVKDKPYVNVSMNPECCYSLREKYVLSCEVLSYPTPANITWSWKPYCFNDFIQCNFSDDADKWKAFHKYYPVNNSTVETIYQSESSYSSLSVIANEPGYYKCTAENKYGTSYDDFMFVVSDANEGFEIVSDNLYPEVHSPFSATCKASSIWYYGLQWKRLSVITNQSLNLPPAKLVHSQFSVALKLDLEKVSVNDSGTYVCVATVTQNDEIQEKSVQVFVQDISLGRLVGNSSSKEVLITIPIILVALFIILGLGCVMKIFYFNKRNKLVLQNFNQQFFQGCMSNFDSSLPLDEQVDLLPYDENWEFPREKLKLGKTLGQGAFGRVVKAEAIGINDYEPSTAVAVKMLKERADVNQQKSLMDELKILIHLGHHVNIVNLMGAVTKNILKEGLMVIVEFCRYGNIRHYLHRHRDSFINEVDPETGKLIPISDVFYSESENSFHDGSSDFKNSSTSSSPGVFSVHNPTYRQTRGRSVVCSNPRGSITFQAAQHTGGSSTSSGSVFRNYYRTDSQENVITTSDLLCYAFQCARGMDYLASKKLIHRDLAARNVLLADDKIVKICDFGLAKDCYKNSNYIKKGDGPLPIKWMSIESIWDHIFTTKSDVWSFGILMWELFTLGGNPYPGVDINEDFYKKLKAGYRMDKPELCPDFAYQIMGDCWNADPDKRPYFDQIAELLGDYLDENVKQHYIDVNEPYMEMNKKMKTPHYSNVETENEDVQTLYVNSKVEDISEPYDVPKVVCRSIYNEPAPAEPMEVVPMIQLESFSEKSPLSESKNRSNELIQVNPVNTLDYLQMQRTHEIP